MKKSAPKAPMGRGGAGSEEVFFFLENPWEFLEIVENAWKFWKMLEISRNFLKILENS